MSSPIEAPPAWAEPTDHDAANDAWKYDDAELEREYQDARRHLLDPPAFQRKTLLLIGTLLLFVLAAAHRNGVGDAQSLWNVVIIVGVLLFHELGHYAGMRAFGYRDVRMFFIPFFGAAVSGTRSGVARWKQALVLLLGPLPGIGVGLALLIGSSQWAVVGPVALMLLVVNGLNLLPVAPLDGGQFFQVLLFSRQRYLEIGFIAAAAILLGCAGLYFGDFILGILGYVLLVSLRYRWRLLRTAHELRLEEPGLPADPAALANFQCRLLFTRACAAMPQQGRGKPRQQANAMDELLDRATQQPPSLRASLALFAGWGCGMLGLVAGAVVLAVLGPPAHWRPYTSSAAAFRVEFPAEPVEKANDAAAGNVVAARGRKRAYAVGWLTLPDNGTEARTWLLRRREQLLERDAGTGTPTLVREDPPGESDLRLSYRLADGTLHEARIVVTDGRLFTVLAAAPDGEADSRRFLDSFQSWAPPRPIGQ